MLGDGSPAQEWAGRFPVTTIVASERVGIQEKSTHGGGGKRERQTMHIWVKKEVGKTCTHHGCHRGETVGTIGGGKNAIKRKGRKKRTKVF